MLDKKFLLSVLTILCIIAYLFVGVASDNKDRTNYAVTQAPVSTTAIDNENSQNNSSNTSQTSEDNSNISHTSPSESTASTTTKKNSNNKKKSTTQANTSNNIFKRKSIFEKETEEQKPSVHVTHFTFRVKTNTNKKIVRKFKIDFPNNVTQNSETPVNKNFSVVIISWKSDSQTSLSGISTLRVDKNTIITKELILKKINQLKIQEFKSIISTEEGTYDIPATESTYTYNITIA